MPLVVVIQPGSAGAREFVVADRRSSPVVEARPDSARGAAIVKGQRRNYFNFVGSVVAMTLARICTIKCTLYWYTGYLRDDRLLTTMRTAFILLGCLSAVAAATESDPKATAFFEMKVRPLLLAKCSECHGARKQEAGLRVDIASAIFRGGDSGRVLVPGKPKESRLLQLVRGEDPDLVMPPERRLEKEEVAILDRWVREGAVWPGYDNTKPFPSRRDGPLFTDEQKAFWAFQPIGDPIAPPILDDGVASPIDAFILARLREHNMKPSSPADKRTLLRRVTFDLTGLPPTLEEIRAFLNDDAPDAWERVVDRLLASPAYGEKWGRHWLDIARFAESAAHDGNNGYLHAWRYRDYVIRSLNHDLPYDEFIVEQLAGDLLPKTGDTAIDLRRLIATGFLQVGPKPVVMRDKQQMLLDIADEQLSTTSVTFLGLTVGCARCHDHKFDPIPIQDYYSLAGIFTSTHVMLDHAADSMWIEPEVPGPGGETVRVMAVQDHKETSNLHIHLRGNYRTLGDEAPRRFLQIIAGEAHRPIGTTASGRLELARWIASEGNPLTARVAVNRIWGQHFGRGIVSSPDDFGIRGEEPTHPELLDWLARQFIDSGWSVKAMHRLMLLSNTYQQTSNCDSHPADPDNRLLSRMPRRRLTAEEVRDSILMATGSLDREMGGTLFTSGYSFNRPDVKLSVVNIGDPDNYAPFKEPRRSIYLPVIRNQMHPMLVLFDAANEHLPVTERNESTVAPQALFLMNSKFARTSAGRLAISTNRQRDDMRIQAIHERLLGRPPTDSELADSRQFVRAYREAIGFDPDAAPGSDSSTTVDSYAGLVQKTPGLLAYYRLSEIRTIDGRAVTPNLVQPSSSPGSIINGATFGIDGAVPHQAGHDQKNAAIELNGKNQRIQIDDVSFLESAADAITIEYWIKPAVVEQQYGVGLDHLAQGQRFWKSGLHTVNLDGKQQLVIYHEFFGAGGGFRFATSKDAVVEVGEWSHVVFNLGQGRRQLFVNGKLVEEFKIDARPTFGKAPLTFGSRADGTEWLQGGIDEVAIYDRVLDERTVRNHHLLGTGSTPESLDPDFAVWQSLCQAVFCMNEFIFVD